jgi:hypothetical protein
MTIGKSRAVPALLAGVVAFFLAGCQSAQQTTPAEAAAPPAAPAVVPETQRVAEAVLGKQAEVVARGDLAGNGSEQLLVVNRFEKGARGDVVPGNSSAMFVTRAVIVEKKDDGKWAEVLRCDEHLKNPRGYLGGSPAAPVTGWRLEFTPDTDRGLELLFTPSGAGEQRPSDEPDRGGRTIAVRWNARAKRYQSLDQSKRGYLGEAPTLETPQSILR